MPDDAEGAPPPIDPAKADAAIRFSFVQQGVSGGGQKPPTPLGVDDVHGDYPSRAYHFTVASDHKVYGIGDILPDGPSFPMTMTLRMMHGVIVVHSEILHPAGTYTDSRGHVIDTFRPDTGSSLVNNYELTTDQGKGFGSVLRNEHRFFQFVPEEGDYLGAVRANVVNLQDRGFLFQFRPPADEVASPTSGGAVSGTPRWSVPQRRLGCAAVLVSLGIVGALIATILDYSPYWDVFDDGPSAQVAAPDISQNTGSAPALPVLPGFPDAKQLLDRLGFDTASERKLEAGLTTLQPHDLFYSDSSKKPGLDASWLKIRAYSGGYVDITASWATTLNQRFPCGSVVDGGRTTCAAGATGFTGTGYWIGQMILSDKIPASDPSTSFTFGFVAGDSNPANNFKASPPFDKDLYNQTKYWYEFGHVVSPGTWSLQLRVFPQTASPALTGAIVINRGDTVFWAIPEKELPSGDLHFNVTTFGFKALPPDPATAAVDALSDPRNPLPLAPRTMLSVGSSSSSPAEAPGAAQAPGDLTASFQTYLSEFADKFRVRDNAYLFDHLNPAVLEVYSADLCRASLAPRKADPTFRIEVRSVTGPASFDYQAEGKTITVPGVYTVASQLTTGGTAAAATQHFTYENGKLTWFTTCTTAGQ